MSKLRSAPKRDLITVTGGDRRGDPCEGLAHHGYDGQEADVVAQIAAGIKANQGRGVRIAEWAYGVQAHMAHRCIEQDLMILKPCRFVAL